MEERFLEELYLEMYNKIYAFAYVRLEDEQLAQELVQDVFVLAQEKLAELRKSENPQGWLIRAAGYAVLHAQRTRSMIRRHFVPLQEEAATPERDAQPGLRELLKEEEWLLLKQVYCDGYSVAEAAALHGLSFEACKKRLYRLKKRLRQELPEEYRTRKGGKTHAG